MRVFVAGATGAIGKQLVPRLVAAGHEARVTWSAISRLGAEQLELVRRRRFPLVGDGGGVWSFIHVRVPRFVGRLFAGEAGVVMMTDVRGASNAKAKRELAWRPAHPSWRPGFAAAAG
jgi:uncharacterized protein YbjT (DUF2867 family)